MTIDLNKREVRVTWRYAFARKTVWEALAAGRLFMTCGGRMVDYQHDFKVGGRYTYAWAPGKSCTGVYTEITPMERLRFSWGGCGYEDAEPSQVCLTLSERGSYTIIEIVHTHTPNAEAAHSYHQGWTEVLALMNDELDGQTIRVHHDFKASRRAVYAAIAEGRLFRFTVPSEADFAVGKIDFKEGGTYYYPCGVDQYVKGTFTKIEVDEVIRFTWSTFVRGVEVKDTEVAIYLQELPNGHTRLYLTHDGLYPQVVSNDHVEGWNDAIAKFAGALA